MSDNTRNFHEFALQSSLFKGRSDWYFCFLKAERIAHVLAVIVDSAPEAYRDDLYALRDRAGELAPAIAELAAGRMFLSEVSADVFSLLSTLRLLHTRSVMTKDTVRVLIEEYEMLAEKLEVGERMTSFLKAEDFAVPMLPVPPVPTLTAMLSDAAAPSPIKDISKGQSMISKGNAKRAEEILTFIRQKQSVSIKDITAVIRGCSEKTIQRELVELIRQGAVRKVGERRWSQYVPT